MLNTLTTSHSTSNVTKLSSVVVHVTVREQKSADHAFTYIHIYVYVYRCVGEMIKYDTPYIICWCLYASFSVRSLYIYEHNNSIQTEECAIMNT